MSKIVNKTVSTITLVIVSTLIIAINILIKIARFLLKS